MQLLAIFLTDPTYSFALVDDKTGKNITYKTTKLTILQDMGGCQVTATAYGFIALQCSC